MRAQVNGSVIFQMPAVRNKRATAKAATWLALVFQTGILFAILADYGLYGHYSGGSAAVDRGGARPGGVERDIEDDARVAWAELGFRQESRHQDRRTERRYLPRGLDRSWSASA